MRAPLIAVLLSIFAGAASLTASGAIPRALNYQGVLTNAGGSPVNSAVVMTFRIYGAATGGTALYTETQLSVTVTNGNFNAVIGSVTPLTLPFDVPYWLTVAVNSDPEMTPRQPMTSTPYAMRAAELDGGAVAAITANMATLGGNATSGTAVLGTTTNFPVEVYANNFRAIQIVPTLGTPNIAMGARTNSAGGMGTVGATVGGGGRASNVGCTHPETNASLPCTNRALGDYSTVAGGHGNAVASQMGFVGGGERNFADGYAAVVAGGTASLAKGDNSSVAGGGGNFASGPYSFVGGGGPNFSTGQNATIAGGGLNTASGSYATIPGGYANQASGSYSFSAGFNGTASGENSFALGTRAKASHHYSFVWGGSPDVDTNTLATGDFVVYAPTAVRLFAGPPGSGGCTLTSGSGWACASDRELKENIQPADTRELLNRIASLPVSTWNMKGATGIRQIGPMAQDFRAAFGFGADDKTITTTDAQGVAFAAIQGLYHLFKDSMAEKESQIARQDERIRALEKTLEKLARSTTIARNH